MSAIRTSRTPGPRKRTTELSVAALSVFAMLAACSSDGDGATPVVPETSAPGDDTDTIEVEAEESAGDELVSAMPLISATPIPAELSPLTGIAWNEASGHFLAVSESGQIASLDGDSLEPVGIIESDADLLVDITIDADGPVALSSTGDRLVVSIDAAGVPEVIDIRASTIDFEPRGVVFSSDVDAPLVGRDTPDGPSLWALDATSATDALQLDDSTLTAASSLAVINGKFLASDADAPTVTIFDEDGSFGARLGAEGMSSIEGITNRDGTFVFVGLDTAGTAVLASYNLTDGQEIDPDPASGPATLTTTLEATQSIDLPDGITQPSGIAYDTQSESMLINTDQGEFFALSADLSEIRFDFDAPGFGQGNIEDIHVTGPGQAAMVVEDASYVPFRYDGTTWSAGDRVIVDARDADVSAIGFDAATERLVYIPEDGPGKTLIVTTLDGEFVEEIVIDTDAVGIENLDDYTVAGLSYSDGAFYVLSEQYSTVFTMTPQGEVTGAFGLADVEEPSGLTVHDGSIWVVLDHEDSEPAPPVVRYPVPEQS